MVLIAACTSDPDDPPATSSEVGVRAFAYAECGAYPCFFTAEDVLAFAPSEIDPTLVATVPLADRPERDGPGVMIGPDLGGSYAYSDETFGYPQGGTSGDTHNFHHWPYVDMVYYYFHAVFAVPPTQWINAAHRNGVPIIGVMTGDCDGCGAELTKLFGTDASTRTQTVDLMVATADAFGFDGWLVDFEEGFAFNDHVKAALEDLRQRTLANGRHPLVTTYVPGSGGIDQFTYPIFEVSDFFQGDYHVDPLPPDTYAYLDSAGQADRRFDVYWAKNVPFWEASADYCSAGSGSDWIFNGNTDPNPSRITTGPCLNVGSVFGGALGVFSIRNEPGADPTYYQSLALFGSHWTTYGAGPPLSTELAEARAAHQEAERQLWIGFQNSYRGDPCALADQGARAVAAVVKPMSAASFPLVTTFNTGEGSAFAIDGRTVANRLSGWVNLSAQDVVPTYFCDVSGTTPDITYDYTDPYDGGSALSVSVTLDAGDAALVRLYELSAKLPDEPEVAVVVRSGDDVSVDVILFLADGSRTALPVMVAEEWQESMIDASSAAGAQIEAVGLQISNGAVASAEVSVLIGELRLYDGTAPAAPEPIAVFADDSGSLSWSYGGRGDVAYANVYARTGECNQFIGRAFVTSYRAMDHPLFGVPADAEGYIVQPVTVSGDASPVDPVPCSS